MNEEDFKEALEEILNRLQLEDMQTLHDYNEAHLQGDRDTASHQDGKRRGLALAMGLLEEEIEKIDNSR